LGCVVSPLQIPLCALAHSSEIVDSIRAQQLRAAQTTGSQPFVMVNRLKGDDS